MSTASHLSKAAQAAPLFALYGEDSWSNDLEFLHVEALALRSRMHDWGIRPHRHADLHQLMWITKGGGRALLDGREVDLPCHGLIAIPPGAVHGFQWEADSEGFVLMVDQTALTGLVPPEDRLLFENIQLLAPPPALRPEFNTVFSMLSEGFRRLSRGRAAAMAAGVLSVVSLIARSAEAAGQETSALSPDAYLVAQFRRAVEISFREHLAVDGYCSTLGITSTRLTRACRAAAGRSPLAIIHERQILEAKRLLTYTAMTVSETAYALGFADPAYFSRFFQRLVGLSPVRFKAGR